ncbi:hypothetical protein [Escherichia coli]|uniref:hypothetical protein n=1 Tax=Escherichia coli TaxID=562 RepID=UPI0020234DF0|nr:hypothetical protein [Escherichia coli]
MPIFFSVGLIDATVTDIMSYVLPYLFIVVLINSRIQGKYRHSFWNEIYEMVLAGILRYRHWWHYRSGERAFNVTAKVD